jgi:hypothetical protein
MKIKQRPIKVDEEFFNIIKKIKIDRIKTGIDLRPQSDRRISKAIARLCEKDMTFYSNLINSPFIDDRNYVRKTLRRKRK